MADMMRNEFEIAVALTQAFRWKRLARAWNRFGMKFPALCPEMVSHIGSNVEGAYKIE